MRSTRGLACAGSVALVALAVAAGPAQSTEASSGSSLAVTYTPQTIVISPEITTSQLESVSADGSTYTFKKAVGPLLSLKPGKVMLLQGTSVGDVTSVSHTGGKLVVHTTEPAIGDVIKSGTVDVNSPIDFARGSLVAQQGQTPKVEVIKGTRATAAGASAATARRADSSIGGTVAGIKYSASVDHTTERLDFEVGYTFEKDGLIAKIDTTGYLDSFDAKMHMLVQNGEVTGNTFLAQPLNGHMHLDWSLGRGDNPETTIKIPAFTLPFSFNVPIIVGGFPFFVKVEFAVLLNVSLSARNATMLGAVDIDYNGSAGSGFSAGGQVSKEGSETETADVDTSLQSITLSSSGAVVALAAPKVIFGIGIPSYLDGTAYVNVITSVGQTTGAAIAGAACSKYDTYVSVTAGVGAQLFLGFLKAHKDLPSAELFSKHVTDAQPGC